MANLLNHSPAIIIQQLLIDMGFGISPPEESGWDGSDWLIFATHEPDTPDNVITVYDIAGTDQGRVMQGELQQHYGFQVRIRARTHSVGWLKADAIRRGLAEDVLRETLTLDSDQYFLQCVANIGQVLTLGKDRPLGKRSLFTVNAVATLRKVS